MSKEFYFNYKNPNVPWDEVTREFGPLTYDDVLIKQEGDTDIESRSMINTSVTFGPYELSKPILSAPMDTVSGENMIIKLHQLGAIGSLPRANGRTPEQYQENYQRNLDLCEFFSNQGIGCLYSIGLKNGLHEARQFKERGAEMILIDVAHGGMASVPRLAAEIRNELGLSIVAGNITTYEQAEIYKKHGVDIARVGVGPGSACTTREKTGVGFPQLSAIFETTEAGMYVIADGGIKKPGDAAKALAAGANMIMVGGMLAGTDETPGEVKNGKKEFRGQASLNYMKDNGVSTEGHRTAEGISTDVVVKGPVTNVIDDIMGGVRSAMSYTGAHNIQEFQEHARFIKITSATQVENQPHISRK